MSTSIRPAQTPASSGLLWLGRIPDLTEPGNVPSSIGSETEPSTCRRQSQAKYAKHPPSSASFSDKNNVELQQLQLQSSERNNVEYITNLTKSNFLRLPSFALGNSDCLPSLFWVDVRLLRFLKGGRVSLLRVVVHFRRKGIHSQTILHLKPLKPLEGYTLFFNYLPSTIILCLFWIAFVQKNFICNDRTRLNCFFVGHGTLSSLINLHPQGGSQSMETGSDDEVIKWLPSRTGQPKIPYGINMSEDWWALWKGIRSRLPCLASSGLISIEPTGATTTLATSDRSSAPKSGGPSTCEAGMEVVVPLLSYVKLFGVNPTKCPNLAI